MSSPSWLVLVWFISTVRYATPANADAYELSDAQTSGKFPKFCQICTKSCDISVCFGRLLKISSQTGNFCRQTAAQAEPEPKCPYKLR